MKQITNKEYDEWQKYKEEKAKGHVLMPDTVRFICEANGYDAYKIGLHFLEILPKITKQHPDNQQCIIQSKLRFTDYLNGVTLDSRQTYFANQIAGIEFMRHLLCCYDSV